MRSLIMRSLIMRSLIMRSLIMRSLILSLLVLQLLLPGAYSEGDDRKPKKPLMCKNPKAKEGQSTWQGCSTSTCKKIGQQALWQPCPKVGLEKTVKENDENLERNHEMSLEILKILGNCCPTTTTWDPASTNSEVDGKWSSWGNWASCDSTGTKKRTRQCDNPPPLNGGAPCAGSSQESAKCPVDGRWGNWGNWAACDSRTGTKKRTKYCNSPPPKNGGAACAGSSQDSATCPVDGKWSSWGNWASCDSTGTNKRTRRCDSPSPKNGGASCAGSSQDWASCRVCGDQMDNKNIDCRGSHSVCGRSFVRITRSVDECMKLCAEREKCKHYIWHKLGNAWAEQCWVVEGEGSYRYENNHCISGTCFRGCGAGWTKFGSHCYKFFGEAMTWFDAEARCVKEGSHLASVHSAEENQFLVTLSPISRFSIGGNAIDDYRTWVWSDWSAWKYTNWHRGEPNDGNERCVHMIGGKWFDSACLWSSKFICKKK